MSVAWVAGSVRARAVARRQLGPQLTRGLASASSLQEAFRMLAATPYGRAVQPGQTLSQAQHAIAATALWNLRVLAGWLPCGGALLLRELAGWFEIANVDGLLQALNGGQPEPDFQLGALATAWPQLSGARSLAALRDALAASAWGDPGGASAHAIRLGMRARWAVRAAGAGTPVRSWATAGAALLAAGERFAAGRPLSPTVRSVLGELTGDAPLVAGTLAEMAAALPPRARWALDGVTGADSLWRAEAAWWARVQADGARLLRSPAFGSPPVLGAAALLAADAWRVRSALEIAARGGGPLEAYDAVA